MVLDGVDKVYKVMKKSVFFSPYNPRLKDLRKEFSFSFSKANTVILLPVYAAGEKIELGFNYYEFAGNHKKFKGKIILSKDNPQLAKFIKIFMEKKL